MDLKNGMIFQADGPSVMLARTYVGDGSRESAKSKESEVTLYTVFHHVFLQMAGSASFTIQTNSQKLLDADPKFTAWAFGFIRRFYLEGFDGRGANGLGNAVRETLVDGGVYSDCMRMSVAQLGEKENKSYAA